MTIGVEEEYLLVDAIGRPAPAAAWIVTRAGGDPRLRTELPVCQVEMATPPRRGIAAIEADLRCGRAAVSRWCKGLAVPISAAVHPFVDQTPVSGGRARDQVRRYGRLARHQLVGALQVHVAVGDPDLVVAVHDELRAHLPLVAGLAAAAPYARGQDTGFASIRPFVTALLPRQGIPPVFGSLARYADALDWAMRSGAVTDPTEWWWDLRIHPRYGTLEVRVADAQPTVSDAMGVVEFVVALVRHLTERAAAADLGVPSPTWCIDENRRAVAMAGLAATIIDSAGHRRRGDEALLALVEVLEAAGTEALARTRRLVGSPAHRRLRSWGSGQVVERLGDAFGE